MGGERQISGALRPVAPSSYSGQLADESLEILGMAGMFALKFQLCESEVERMPTVHGGSPLSIVSGEAGGRVKKEGRPKRKGHPGS